VVRKTAENNCRHTSLTFGSFSAEKQHALPYGSLGLTQGQFSFFDASSLSIAHIAFVIAIARVAAVPNFVCVSSKWTVHFHGSGPISLATVYCFPRYSIWNQFAGTQIVRGKSFAPIRNFRPANVGAGN
jgi:hypothetical protein